MKRFINGFFLIVISVLYVQRAVACPDQPQTTAQLIASGIYFCLTPSSDYTADSFAVSYTAEQLLSGGSQAVGQGNASVNTPLPIQTDSVTVTSPSFTPLAASGLTAIYPTTTNTFGSNGSFNFYSTVPATETGCPSSSYTTVINYLRANPNLFIINGTTPTSDFSSSTSIAKATGPFFTNSAGKSINATVEFYWSNNQSGQFFTRGATRYCWLAVAERVTFDENSFVNSGEYSAAFGITTPVGTSIDTFTVTIPEIVVLYHLDSININFEDYLASYPDLSVHSATVPISPTATINGSVDTTPLSNLLSTLVNVTVQNAWAVQSIAPNSVTLSSSINTAILWNLSGSSMAIRNLMLKSAASSTPATSITLSPSFDASNLTEGDVVFELDFAGATHSGSYSGASFNLNLQSN